MIYAAHCIEGMPCLPLGQRFDLPSLAAIYFVLDESGAVGYVGAPQGLIVRWSVKHHKVDRALRADWRMAWLECPNGLPRDLIERELIA